VKVNGLEFFRSYIGEFGDAVFSIRVGALDIFDYLEIGKEDLEAGGFFTGSVEFGVGGFEIVPGFGGSEGVG